MVNFGAARAADRLVGRNHGRFEDRCSRVGIALPPVRPWFRGGSHGPDAIFPDPHPLRPLRCGVSPYALPQNFGKRISGVLVAAGVT